MEYNRAQLKQSVKEQIKSTRPRPLWITLLFLVVTAAGGWVINLLMSSLNWSGAIVNYFFQLTVQGVEAEEAAEYILQIILRNGAEMISLIILGSLLIAFVTYLWESLMGVGYKGYCLDVARGRQPGVGRLFQAFPRIGGVLLTRILTWVFTFLWSLLFLLGFLVVLFIGLALVSVSSLLGGLVIFAGIVAYAVAAIWLSLRYSRTTPCWTGPPAWKPSAPASSSCGATTGGCLSSGCPSSAGTCSCLPSPWWVRS